MSHRSRPRSLSKYVQEQGISNKTESMPEQAYNSKVTFIQYLMSEYGNIGLVMEIADTLLDFAKRFRKKDNRYQTALTMLKYGIPAALFTSQFMAKLKRFRDIKSGKAGMQNDREKIVRTVLGIKDEDGRLSQDDFYVGKDVFSWLMQHPKTNKVKLLGFYTYDGLVPITDVWAKEASTMVISIECGSTRFVWIVAQHFSDTNEDFVFNESKIYLQGCNWEKVAELKATLYKEFLNHFDVKSNILLLHPLGLEAYPRQEVKEKIRQFSLDIFSDEIRKVLKRGTKRGYALVGLPGTGKSTIIRKLEDSIRDYPIVYTTAANYNSDYNIRETFMTIVYLQPCIVVMEDLDSYELRDKKSTLGVFLNEIDDVNGRLNVVILSTINDTSLVHYALINRPGRFDQVVMVKPPQCAEEVYEVMKTRYDRNRGIDSSIQTDFMDLDDIDMGLLSNITEHQYTQADICELIEKSLLIGDIVTNESLKHSLDQLKESKEAIRRCSFDGKDPNKLDYVTEDVPQPAGISITTYRENVKRYANRA